MQLGQITIGDPVVLTERVGEHPLATSFPAGTCGTVEQIEEVGIVWVRLDEPCDELAEWDNCLQIGPEEHGGFGVGPDGEYPLRLGALT